MSWEFENSITTKRALVMGVAVDFMSTDNLNHRPICKSYPLIRVIDGFISLTFQKFTIICIIVALLFIIILSHHHYNSRGPKVVFVTGTQGGSSSKSNSNAGCKLQLHQFFVLKVTFVTSELNCTHSVQQLSGVFKRKNTTTVKVKPLYCYVLCFGYYPLTAFIVVFDFIFLLCLNSIDEGQKFAKA